MKQFYIIAHRTNDSDSVMEALDCGANAFECDIQFKGGQEFRVDHNNIGASDTLIEFLQQLCNKLQRRNQDKLALMIFDCKDTHFDVNILLHQIRTNFTDLFPKIKILLSIPDFEDRSFFSGMGHLRVTEGVSIDYKANPVAVRDFFTSEGITNYCYADGVNRWGGGLSQSRIKTNLRAAISLNAFKLNYVWTLAAKSAMREHLDLGVNGIMVHDIEALREVLRESTYAENFEIANQDYNPFFRLYIPPITIRDRLFRFRPFRP